MFCSHRYKLLFLMMIIFPALLLYGCNMPSSGTNPKPQADTVAVSSSIENEGMLIPTAPGVKKIGNTYVSFDISNTKEGYFQADYLGENPKVKLQLTGPNQVTYTFNITGDPCFLPFTCGSGDYQIALYENIEGTQYATVFQETLHVSIENEFGPFLYPNLYVDFTEQSEAVQIANEISSNADGQIKTISDIYYYVAENITYDYEKADSVEYNYLPNIDEVLKTRQGICFDYASLMAAMLRSQKIPTRLEIGYAGEEYHAWISTYTQDEGWIDGIIRFDGKEWSIMDPTFASTGNFSKDTNRFITNKDNYTTIYTY